MVLTEPRKKRCRRIKGSTDKNWNSHGSGQIDPREFGRPFEITNPPAIFTHVTLRVRSVAVTDSLLATRAMGDTVVGWADGRGGEGSRGH